MRRLLLLAAMLPSLVCAQQMPSATIDVQPETSIGTTNVTITWTCTNAATARAIGGWSGIKALTGTEVVTGVATDRVYSIECRTALGRMTVSWTAVTKNQDGSPATITGYRVYEATTYLGVPAGNRTDVSATTLSQLLWLPPGTHYAGVTAIASGVESLMSNIGQKNVQWVTATATDSITITPRPAKTTVTVSQLANR